ncbi:unnamed protein product [Adineta ricciae]|uniref:G-protein coupled receptors family 1 profile domain-containing protein n=1 Tax=Adineta ricciae TaxID=249248 RepID=A0A813P224_ADIRI|nr:unnamed protein product [Adineta ricciae]CAF1112819.1 unnamed protein product [Adineta ricciae]
MSYENSTEFTTTIAITSTNIRNSSQAVSSAVITLLGMQTPVIILVWFEIISAGIVYGFGFIGNLIASVIFLSREDFRTVSTGVLFLLLTLSNTVHLWTLTTEFLGIFNIYVYSGEFLQCRLNYFVQNVSRTVSTYISITVTLDRLIRTEYPIKSRRICTCKNAIKSTIAYLIISSISYSFWFHPSNSISSSTGGCTTGLTSAYTFFFSNIFLPLRFIFVCVVPVIIMSLGNFRILYNIQQSRRRVTQAIVESNIAGGKSNRRTTILDRLLLHMMIINVCAFVITQVPFHIYTIVRTYSRDLGLVDALLVRTMLLVWQSIYFGIGSYFHCIASSLFRKAFREIIKKILFC